MAQVGIYETYPMQVVPPHNHTTINEGNVLNIDNIINYNTANFSTEVFPDVPSVQADHFSTAILDPKWTPFHPGGGLVTTLNRHHLIYTNTGDGAGNILRGHFQVCPAGDFTMLAKVDTIMCPMAATWSAGIALFEDAVLNPNTCKIITLWIEHSGAGFVMYLFYWTDYQTWSAQAATLVHINELPRYLRIRRIGAGQHFDWSLDGVGWYPLFVDLGGWFAPKEMGLIQRNASVATTGRALFDWFYYHPANVLISPVGSSFK
jgi:hypothetical protein